MAGIWDTETLGSGQALCRASQLISLSEFLSVHTAVGEMLIKCESDCHSSTQFSPAPFHLSELYSPASVPLHWLGPLPGCLFSFFFFGDHLLFLPRPAPYVFPL